MLRKMPKAVIYFTLSLQTVHQHYVMSNEFVLVRNTEDNTPCCDALSVNVIYTGRVQVIIYFISFTEDLTPHVQLLLMLG